MIFEQLKTMLAEQFGVEVESITMETSFEDDLGADSLDLVDMSMAMEEVFGVDEMTEEEISGITSCKAAWITDTK